jgi:hypothetical protein
MIWRNEHDERKSVGRLNTYVINKGYCCQGIVLVKRKGLWGIDDNCLASKDKKAMSAYFRKQVNPVYKSASVRYYLKGQ